MDLSKPNRRTVLKGIGAGVAGSAALSGAVSAGDTGNNRRQDSFTWGDGVVWEMLESEPPEVYDHVDAATDSEGSHQSHRPLWVIDAMDGTGVAGSDHSPHPAPIDGIDHVVPLGGGGEFTAQWHVHLVLDEPFEPALGFGNLANLTNTDGAGDYLISADAIENASEPDVFVVPLFNPETGEPDVFTCPVRPHQH